MKIFDVEKKYQDFADSIFTAHHTGIALNMADFVNLDFEERNIALAKIIKNIECENAGVKDALSNMRARAETLEFNVKQLKNFILLDISSSGLLDPIKCSDIVIKLQNNPPSLDITDPDLLPDIYKIVKEVITFDKMSIKRDIEAGFEVEGAKIINNKRLVIK
jgi:Siphovirus Gp157